MFKKLNLILISLVAGLLVQSAALPMKRKRSENDQFTSLSSSSSSSSSSSTIAAEQDKNPEYTLKITDKNRPDFQLLLDSIEANPNVTDINASFSKITDFELNAILDICGDTVETLNLDFCEHLKNPAVCKCPNLKSLSLFYVQFDDEQLNEIFAQCGKTLTILNLSGNYTMQEPDFDCPNLRILNLVNCFNLTDEQLNKILILCGDELITLNLDGCASLQNPIIACPQLQGLSIRNSVVINRAGEYLTSKLQALTINCPKLEWLSLNGYKGRIDAGVLTKNFTIPADCKITDLDLK